MSIPAALSDIRTSPPVSDRRRDPGARETGAGCQNNTSCS